MYLALFVDAIKSFHLDLAKLIFFLRRQFIARSLKLLNLSIRQQHFQVFTFSLSEDLISTFI